MENTKRKRSTRRDKIVFTKKQIHQIESLAGVGMTVAEICDYLGVSKKTFERRVNESEELHDALRVGRTRAQAQVYKAAYEMATSKKHSDFTKFYMRSRYSWSERNDIHIHNEDINPEDSFLEKIKTMSTEELEDFVAQGRKRSE